jgi:hypothetical protein
MNTEIENIYNQIGQQIVKVLPHNGWDNAIVTVKMITRFSEMEGVYTKTSDTALQSFDPGFDTLDAFERLRRLMAQLQPQKGAWYTAVFTMRSTGKFHLRFDYDNLPDFTYKPSSDKYEEDARMYPR